MTASSHRSEKIAFHRFADMPFVETMSVCDTHRHFSAFHETFTLCMNMTHGGAEWIYRGKRERGYGEMLMLMEPGEIHRTTKLLGNPGSFRVVHLNPSWLAEMAQQADIPADTHFSAGMSTDPRLYGALRQLQHALDCAASLLERETRLMNLLDAIFRHGLETKAYREPPGKPTNRLREARDFLIENYDRKTTLDDLAAVAGLTKFHFVRSFARAYGVTPHAFLMHVRTSRARKHLRSDSRLNGTELGFFDQSHFIRVFSKIVGTTPARYAQLAGAKHAGVHARSADGIE